MTNRVKNIYRALRAAKKTFDRRYADLIKKPYYDDEGVPPDYPTEKYKDAISQSHLVFSCIDRIANAVADLPMIFYQGKAKNAKVIEDHHLVNLFHRPNDFDTHRQMWYGAAFEYLSTGEAYLVGDREVPKIGPQELWQLPSDQVNPITDKKTFISGFKVSRFGNKIVYPTENVIWFKSYNSKNPWRGFPKIAPLQKVLAGIHYAYSYELNYFKNDTTPGGILEAEGAYDEDNYKRTLKSFVKRHGGYKKPYIPEILYNMKYKETGKSPKDLAFKELIELYREDVVGAFGLPPSIMSIFRYSNYANALIQLKMFWLIAVMPIIKDFESIVNWNFIERWYPGQKIWMEFDTSGIEALQKDRLEQAQTFRSYIEAGIMTPNEVRINLNLPERPDGNDLVRRSTEKPSSPDDSKVGLYSDRILRFKVMGKQVDRWWSKEEVRQKFEKKYYMVMRDFFKAQAERILKNFDRVVADRKISLYEIYDTVGEIESLKETTLPVFKQILKDSGNLAIDEVQQLKSFRNISTKDGVISGNFDYVDPDILDWIIKHAAEFITNIDKTTTDAIKAILHDGYQDGLTIKEIAGNIRTMYEDNFSITRAVTVARTETGAAFNKGIKEGYKQAKGVKKGWLPTPDEITRPDHWNAGQQAAIPIDEKFRIGNDLLDYPGDPSGSPEQVINCRCTIEPVLESV